MHPSVSKSAHALPPGLCSRCHEGDHSQHQAKFAGICIGCVCSFRPGRRSPATGETELIARGVAPGLGAHRPLATLSDENALIDRIAECIRFYGCHEGPDADDAGEYDEIIEFAYGHSGEGWYLSCGSYPDEGAEFIGSLEYGALMVAQAIVAEERAALAGPLPFGELPWAREDLSVQSPAVTFQAQLMAGGDAQELSGSLAELGTQPVMIFTADVEDVRRAAPLFRKKASLTALPLEEGR